MKFNFLISCYFILILSYIWIFLFPLISITTNELKLRQLYVDEHSLLTTSISITNYTYYNNNNMTHSITYKDNYDNININQNINQNGIQKRKNILCNFNIFQINNIDCKDYYYYHQNILYYSFFIQSNQKQLNNNEVIIICILVSDEFTNHWIISFVHSLIINIQHSKWLSKSINILLIPKHDVTTNYLLLKDWIDNYHYPNYNHISSSLYHGIIRFAMILDLDKVQQNNSDKNNNHNVNNLLLSWKDGVEVSFIGSNNQLPNMDTISSLLSLPSHTFTSIQYLQNSSFSNYIYNKLLDFFNKLPLSSTYKKHFSYLILFFLSLLSSPHGYHDVFLKYHINSFTLHPLSPVYHSSNLKPSQKHSKDISISTFLSLIGTIIQLHCNLHGNLSYFFTYFNYHFNSNFNNFKIIITL